MVDPTTIISITSSAIAGGLITSIISKLWMDKKDAAAISSNLITSLFAQHQTLLLKVEEQERNIATMHKELIAEREENASLRSKLKELSTKIDNLKRELSKHQGGHKL